MTGLYKIREVVLRAIPEWFERSVQSNGALIPMFSSDTPQPESHQWIL